MADRAGFFSGFAQGFGQQIAQLPQLESQKRAQRIQELQAGMQWMQGIGTLEKMSPEMREIAIPKLLGLFNITEENPEFKKVVNAFKKADTETMQEYQRQFGIAAKTSNPFEAMKQAILDPAAFVQNIPQMQQEGQQREAAKQKLESMGPLARANLELKAEQDRLEQISLAVNSPRGRLAGRKGLIELQEKKVKLVEARRDQVSKTTARALLSHFESQFPIKPGFSPAEEIQARRMRIAMYRAVTGDVPDEIIRDGVKQEEDRIQNIQKMRTTLAATETAGDKARAKVMSEQANTTLDLGRSALGIRNTTAMLQNALQRAEPGVLADVRQVLGKFLKFAGADDEWLRNSSFIRGEPGALELLDAGASDIVTRLFDRFLANLNQEEVKIAENIFMKATSDPKAARLLVEMFQIISSSDIEQARNVENWVGGGDLFFETNRRIQDDAFQRVVDLLNENREAYGSKGEPQIRLSPDPNVTEVPDGGLGVTEQEAIEMRRAGVDPANPRKVKIWRIMQGGE